MNLVFTPLAGGGIRSPWAYPSWRPLFGLGWLVLILGSAYLGRLRRAVHRRVHGDDAAAGFGRRPAQSDRRQPHHHRSCNLIGTPIGILAGTYMAEYGRYDRLTSVVRFINDILLSAPSIVVGLFIYEVIGRPDGAFFRDWRGPWRLR